MKSIKSVHKIGHGPSSSHTVGPYHAAQIFGARYPEADRVIVTLYGSLAFTGEGHGTGKAIRSGLPGAKILINRAEKNLPHPNTMLFEAYKEGQLLGWARTGSSVSVAAPSASRMRPPRKRSRSTPRKTSPGCCRSAGTGT